MVQGEAFLLCNIGFCACALPLGGRLAGLKAPSPARLGLAALLSGVCALAELWLPGGWGLIGLPGSVWLCFGRHGCQACVRCAVTTFGAALLCGGGMTMLLKTQADPWLCALAAGAMSLLMYLLAALLPTAMIDIRQVELLAGGQSVLLPAMVDSGNLLRDPITGLPVLVIPLKAALVLYPDIRDWWDRQRLPEGFRLLNVRTAAGSGLLPLFRPDGCRLYFNGRRQAAELLVAVAGREYAGVQALVPLAALPPETALKRRLPNAPSKEEAL